MKGLKKWFGDFFNADGKDEEFEKAKQQEQASGTSATPVEPKPEQEALAQPEVKPEPEAKPESEPKPKAVAEPKQEPQKQEARAEESPMTAAEMRIHVIEKILDMNKNAIDAQNPNLAKMIIWLEGNERTDAMYFAWADDKFRSGLNLRLKENLMAHLGSSGRDIIYKPADEIPEDARKVTDRVYLSFAPESRQVKKQGDHALIRVLSPAGVSGQDSYEIDPSVESSLYIGRGTGDGTAVNHIALDSSLAANVSRRHARIVFDNGRYFLRDLGSSNGTILCRAETEFTVDPEPTRVTYPLQEGDTIILGGQVRLHFSLKE